jgi:metallo-beta-lactamase family protein
MFDPAPPLADFLVVDLTMAIGSTTLFHLKKPWVSVLSDALPGGTVVIPAFAVGRAQSLLYYLSLLKKAGRLQGVPVHLDSPMAIDASGIMCANSGIIACRMMNAAACAVAHYVRDADESKALTADSNPKVIISASGMATGGRVLHHLAQFAPDPKNLLLFAGFRQPVPEVRRLSPGRPR